MFESRFRKGAFDRYSNDNKPLLWFERIDFSQVEHRGNDDFPRFAARNWNTNVCWCGFTSACWCIGVVRCSSAPYLMSIKRIEYTTMVETDERCNP